MTTPYRSDQPPGRDGFAQLLHAEWTKFRTVRGWVVGSVAAVLVMVLFGLLIVSGSRHTECVGRQSKTTCGPGSVPRVPVGPGGQPVSDTFYFVHQALRDHGSITARVSSLTGLILPGPERPPAGLRATRAAVQPWAKAGIIVKQNTRPGSAYAAIMVTGGHGVRMQDNFTHDTAGAPGQVSAASPRWLRLTRSGATLTGFESSDGRHWTKVGTAHLNGLPSTVPTGMFVTSPPYEQTTTHLGSTSGEQFRTRATARFDHVGVQGGGAGGWTGTQLGGNDPMQPVTSGFQRSTAGFLVTGSGDIAPSVDLASPIENSIQGAFATLIVVAVLGALFVTGEYRRGLIRTTLAASPRRGRVLAAKAIVIGSVSFVAGLVATAVTLAIGTPRMRANGNYLYPVDALTKLRVELGTAALIAVAAVLAVALGTILRRGAGAVAAVVVLVVLPFILSVSAVLPLGAAQWVLRLSPAAAFGIQQTVPQYAQVSYQYTPQNGFFPLAPWAGLAVLCGYAALALAVAGYLLRRRDA
jgi:ABC-type transport system involved in multi-copper enzyme maturation permease subunit